MDHSDLAQYKETLRHALLPRKICTQELHEDSGAYSLKIFTMLWWQNLSTVLWARPLAVFFDGIKLSPFLSFIEHAVAEYLFEADDLDSYYEYITHTPQYKEFQYEIEEVYRFGLALEKELSCFNLNACIQEIREEIGDIDLIAVGFMKGIINNKVNSELNEAVQKLKSIKY